MIATIVVGGFVLVIASLAFGISMGRATERANSIAFLHNFADWLTSTPMKDPSEDAIRLFQIFYTRQVAEHLRDGSQDGERAKRERIMKERA